MGKTLCADSITEDQLRLGFAHVLVEVNLDYDFPKEIEILDLNGVVIKVGIEYPWLPIKCRKCNSFGHASHTRSKIEKRIWIPRKRDKLLQVNGPTKPIVLKEKNWWDYQFGSF